MLYQSGHQFFHDPRACLVIYVYTLRDPVSRDIRYIGISRHPRQRLSEHCCATAGSIGRQQWFRMLRTRGQYPYMEIVAHYRTRGEALAEERRLIALHRATVLNGTDERTRRKANWWRNGNDDDTALDSVRTAAAKLGISHQRLYQLRTKTGHAGPVTLEEMAALVARKKGKGGRPRKSRE